MTVTILPGDMLEARTVAELAKRIAYDPDTGELRWLHRPVEMFSDTKQSAAHSAATWNGRYAGKPALTALTGRKNDRRVGRIWGQPYLAHRVAFALYHGRWPSGQIDHINGDGLDNRISNLREATNQENQRNSGPQRNNTSGYKGVYWHKQRGKWCAQAQNTEGKHKSLGLFHSIEDAAAAYDAFARAEHGDFYRKSYP